MKFTTACIQLNSGNDLNANLARGMALIREGAASGAKFIACPENSFFMRGEGEEFPAAENITEAMQNLAANLSVWLQFCVMVRSGEKYNNRCILLSPDGTIVAQYDKIHLFDVDVPGGESHRESDSVAPGDRAVIVEMAGVKLGMAICYDLRFPQLFRSLAQGGAQVITVPSAFTYKTGEAHWQVLLRARAIENSCYIIAPAQCGEHPRGRRTYGHSLIIDPWGKILAEGSEGKEEAIMAEIDVENVAKIRAALPSLKHDRKFNSNT